VVLNVCVTLMSQEMESVISEGLDVLIGIVNQNEKNIFLTVKKTYVDWPEG